jgi:Domain of unknown function (DUF4954)
MNIIKKIPVSTLGYNFIPEQFLPEGENEYYLRNHQNRSGINYRNLTAYEIEVLVRNRNTSDNWNNILVSENFNADLVRNCKFFGLVRIGKLEPLYLEFHSVRFPVGLYNSNIISCDIGDNVVIDNVNYISHYILGNDVIIVNVNEMVNTNYTKFGNGIVKEGEDESGRIWMELCNENGGRRVIPFSGMLPGDAYLWTRNRTDTKLLDKFKQFTENQLETKRGYYGKVGDRTVIKNCKMIKDTWVGSDAYLKGANKIKNVTVNSDANRMSQIGEGCEVVNGIVGYGCKIFYGVKAVRFVMASQSQLKYGARLINSYLGDNATISCCEVLNSLIFPSHEQHHNNSFLCAALIMGQSNLAAGSTIGSNHNSRAADGEIIANRGFWPGLCVSLKHNSNFASFTMIAKGDYNYELNIPLPFSLVSIEESENILTVMPAYWFMYNMYALARNASKYAERDKRTNKIQLLEFNYLAPDTINEIVKAIAIIEELVGEAWYKKEGKNDVNKTNNVKKGKQLLKNEDIIIETLNILANGFENNKRQVKIIKAQSAYNSYQKMLTLYCYQTFIDFIVSKNLNNLQAIKKQTNIVSKIKEWENVGGQLIPTEKVSILKKSIKNNTIKSWFDVRDYYKKMGEDYEQDKFEHALSCFTLCSTIDVTKINKQDIIDITNSIIDTKDAINKNIYNSRAKDYDNDFRKMSYENIAEMETVIGKLEDNSFILQQNKSLTSYKKSLQLFLKKLN